MWKKDSLRYRNTAAWLMLSTNHILILYLPVQFDKRGYHGKISPFILYISSSRQKDRTVYTIYFVKPTKRSHPLSHFVCEYQNPN